MTKHKLIDQNITAKDTIFTEGNIKASPLTGKNINVPHYKGQLWHASGNSITAPLA